MSDCTLQTPVLGYLLMSVPSLPTYTSCTSIYSAVLSSLCTSIQSDRQHLAVSLVSVPLPAYPYHFFLICRKFGETEAVTVTVLVGGLTAVMFEIITLFIMDNVLRHKEQKWRDLQGGT